MMGTRQSGFEGIDKVESKENRIRFEEEGVYIVALEKVVHGYGDEEGMRPGEPYCAWELRIAKRLSDTGKDEGMVVGKADYLSGKRKKYAQREVKALMAAFMRDPQSEITKESAEQFVEDDGENVKLMWSHHFGCEPLAYLEIKAREKDDTVYHNPFPQQLTEQQIDQYKALAPAEE